MMSKTFMKKANLWILAAVFCCSLVMNSCTDDTAMADNPVPAPEQASAEDPGKWWIDESYMDKSVKLSDDFFMHCIGTWWKNTPIETLVHRQGEQPDRRQLQPFQEPPEVGRPQLGGGRLGPEVV